MKNILKSLIILLSFPQIISSTTLKLTVENKTNYDLSEILIKYFTSKQGSSKVTDTLNIKNTKTVDIQSGQSATFKIDDVDLITPMYIHISPNNKLITFYEGLSDSLYPQLTGEKPTMKVTIKTTYSINTSTLPTQPNNTSTLPTQPK